MAEPMDRSERIGRWVSGIAHAGLIGWAAIGGALFGPQPAPPVQMTRVATMTEAQFQDFAAASRGAGPVQGQQQEVAALPQPAAEDVQSGALEAARSPDPDAEAQPLPEPETEDAPDLTDLAAAQPAVAAATALPQQELPRQDEEQAPEPVTPPTPETATPQPEAPASPALPDATVQPPSLPQPPAPPRSELALDNSPHPRGRPDALVENRNRRLAEQARQAQEEARRQAEAEEAARAAEAQRQAEAAEAEARARAEAEEARARQEAAERAAEDARREEQERLAAEEAERLERERLAAEAAERQEAERLAAEQAERERLERAVAEAAQAERDRIAAEEAERARQEAAEAEQAARDAEAAAEEARQRAEEATPDQDALAAALAEALGDPAPASDSAPGASDAGPLSLSEREGFRLAINECWRVGSLSREAQGTSVTVAFSMSPDGMPEAGTMRLMGHSGGSPAAAQQAYEAAQRAVLNCAGTGYALPAEKYSRWKDVIIDFSPNGVGVN